MTSIINTFHHDVFKMSNSKVRVQRFYRTGSSIDGCPADLYKEGFSMKDFEGIDAPRYIPTGGLRHISTREYFFKGRETLIDVNVYPRPGMWSGKL